MNIITNWDEQKSAANAFNLALLTFDFQASSNY